MRRCVKLASFDCEFDGHAITVNPQPANDANGDCGQIGMMAKAFALVDIGNVYFNEGDRDAGKRIAQGHARMRETTGIDHDGIDILSACGMDAVYQGAFMIALEARQFHAGCLSLRRSSRFDIS